MWDDDSVDIYIDGTHNKLPTYDSNDRFFQKGWNDPALREAGGRISGVLHASANIPGGYSVELGIPWANIGVSASADMTIGFDTANNDDDNGAARDSQSMWAGNGNDYISTSDFGDLYLSGKRVGPEVNTAPTNIVLLATASMLDLSWPADHTGWQLQAQSTSLTTGLGTNWVPVPASAYTNRVVTEISATSGAVYYRLICPYQ